MYSWRFQCERPTLYNLVKEEKLSMICIENVFRNDPEASLNACTEDLSTALHELVLNPNADPEIVRILIKEHGADVNNIRRRDLLTPLQCLVLYNECNPAVFAGLINVLLEMGAEADWSEMLNEFLQQNKTYQGSLEKFRFLLELVADGNGAFIDWDDVLEVCLERPFLYHSLIKEILVRGVFTDGINHLRVISSAHLRSNYYQSPPFTTVFEDCLKAVIKNMLLKDECFFESVARNGILAPAEYHGYAYECFTQLEDMRSVEVFGDISLYMWLQKKSLQDIEGCPEDALQKLLTTVTSGRCRHYNDTLLSLALVVEKKVLLKYLQKLLCTGEAIVRASTAKKTVVLNYDVVCNLTSYLSASDVLNLTVASM